MQNNNHNNLSPSGAASTAAADGLVTKAVTKAAVNPASRRAAVGAAGDNPGLGPEAVLDQSGDAHNVSTHGELPNALVSTAVRQFRFPRFLRGLTEALLFCGIYLVAGEISLGVPFESMLGPMVPIVLLMMFCMVASGVYRSEITNSILNLYIHSIYGFFLASVGFILLTFALPPEYSQPKFIFFFLFFAFFVMNTLRPIISGTDFMDGGGRRMN